jgi:hypothetical protein
MPFLRGILNILHSLTSDEAMIETAQSNSRALSPAACATHYAKLTRRVAADDARLPLLLATYTWHVERCRRDVLPALRRALKLGGPLRRRSTEADAIWWSRRDRLWPLFEQHFALHSHFEPQHLEDPKPLRGTLFDAQALLGALERIVETKPHRESAELRAFGRAMRARWKALGLAKEPTPAELASLAAATGIEPVRSRSEARELWKQRWKAWRDEALTDAELDLARADLALDRLHTLTFERLATPASDLVAPRSELSVEITDEPSSSTKFRTLRLGSTAENAYAEWQCVIDEDIAPSE